MSIEIQKTLPLNAGFEVKESLPTKKNRVKDPIEYSVPTSQQWADIWNSGDPMASLEYFRLKPVTLKVSIDPAVYLELGYISRKLNLKLSEQSLIKEAVEAMVSRDKEMINGSNPGVWLGVGHSASSRMKYVKIKLKASTSSIIGFPGSGGLCDALAMSRQLIVRVAVNEFLTFLKK